MGVVFFALPAGPMRTALLVGIPAVLLWGVLTLHFPSRVVLDDDAVAFFGYGRVHRYRWDDVARVRVRRFLVRDRVMVMIAPAPAWGGRYWIGEGIDGFEELVAGLTRAKAAKAQCSKTPL
jgi:hypothetical protein